jgi:sortase (surface protein transpeptidase)
MHIKRYVKQPPKKIKTRLEKFARFTLFGSFFSFLIATLFSGFPLLVYAWNIISPSTNEYLSSILSNPISFEFKANATEIDNELELIDEYVLPPQDLELPTTPKITIDSIGIQTNILEQSIENYELALKDGVWRVPNFGNPIQREKPIILVAHRFGYLSWDQEYREQNSFFNLPNLETGDQIEVIWDQRKFVYEIYDSEEGTDITKYNADLILYTCKFLKSDVRIFKYARLIEN